MMMVRCSDCRFFCTRDDEIHSDDLTDRGRCLQGRCRRNTPTVGHFRGEDEYLEYDYGQWPLVLSCDWCGAFEPCRPTRHNVALKSPRLRTGNASQTSIPSTGGAISCDVGQRGASNGSFLDEGAVTAAGTVAVLQIVCFACPVFRKPIMEVRYAS